MRESEGFLLDGFSICNPAKLNASDLEDFDKKCTALKKINISTKNVNKSLNKLTALNMPYGGIDIGDYIVKTELNHVKMIQLNNSLINIYFHRKKNLGSSRNQGRDSPTLKLCFLSFLLLTFQ